MGIQTATLANCSFNQPKEAYRPFDFMPSKQAERKQKTEKPKRLSRQKFAESIRSVMSVMMTEGWVVKAKPETQKE